MPRRKKTPDAAVDGDEHVSETDLDDLLSELGPENDENTPLNDENVPDRPIFAPVYSSTPLLHTPRSHPRASHDSPLRDITDQFFHPPSPSPVRISKLKRSAPNTLEPPKRPKKPRSLAYPADPPNWLYSRSSSSLPPSSPFPPSTGNVEPHLTVARHHYHLGTPLRASDSDPFGFVAIERALKAKRGPSALPPPKPTSRISAVKSPPRSTVLSHAHVPFLASTSDAPMPTNNKDIEGLYADEPVAGPSHVHVPSAPLLLMNSDQPFVQVEPLHSQPSFTDPLRTPRKRKRHTSLSPDADPDEDEVDMPSSPSPIKVSVRVLRSSPEHSSHIPVPKRTRAQSRAADKGTVVPPTKQPRTKRTKTSFQHIPTPSSTPVSTRRLSSTRQSTAPPTPVPPRRSTRRAVVGARARRDGTASTSDEEDEVRMRLRPRNAKQRPNLDTRLAKPTTRAKQPSKVSRKTPKATAPAMEKRTRGRPKSKPSAKSTKGKGKTRPLENVLDLSDDMRERYEKERRERLEYFKRLEGYQIQKENVYVV